MSKKRFYPTDKRTLGYVAETVFVFPPTLPISANSNFGDDVWDWMDPQIFRLKGYRKSSLRIDWISYSTALNLPAGVISDLKKYALFRYAYSNVVFSGGREALHPATICREIWAAARLLSKVCAEVTVSGVCLIRKLTDIEIEDLRNCLASCRFSLEGTLKTVLVNFNRSSSFASLNTVRNRLSVATSFSRAKVFLTQSTISDLLASSCCFKNSFSLI